MNETETAILLALANGHDQRQGTDDVKVQAWFALFSQEAPDMDAAWAMEKVNRHYSLMTDMLMPAHLVTAWKARKHRDLDRQAIPSGPGTPMPDWFREQVKGLRRG